VFSERIVIVINNMLVNCSISVPMNDDVTSIVCAENKVEIVVASISGRCFRYGDKCALQGKGYRGRHHDYDGHPLEEYSTGKAQDARPLDNL